MIERRLPPSVQYTRHEIAPPSDAALVDQGIGDYNEAHAPLHEVRGLFVFARHDDGAVLGGAVGRTWGENCELQQLWVGETLRHQGIGSRLMAAFEAEARARQCRLIYLETWSFQALPFYQGLGYGVALEVRGFGPGIVKYTVQKILRP